MSVSLESLVVLANNFAQTKVLSDTKTTNYEKARKVLKRAFESQINSLPIKAIDLTKTLDNLDSYDVKVASKVSEWAKKFQTDKKLQIATGCAIISLDNALLKSFDSECKNVKKIEEYQEFRAAKKSYKKAIKDLKSQGKTVEDIESFLKAKEVTDRAITKALYWYRYKT